MNRRIAGDEESLAMLTTDPHWHPGCGAATGPRMVGPSIQRKVVDTDMQRMHRALGILPVLTLAVAACAAPQTGAGDASSGPESSAAASPSTSSPSGTSGTDASGGASASPAPEAGSAERIDIGVLAGDPGAVAGSELRVLARVDEVLSDGQAFYTSPSGTDEGRLLVVLADDARVDKEMAQGAVLWVDGTVVGGTGEELESAGAATTELPSDYEGDHVLVASVLADPLAGEG